MRGPFRQIPKEVYLFSSILGEGGGPNSREEPVRQWCAFELIRSYGIHPSDLSFEEQVKIGSKTYRIDILVKRDGSPWIVIECKEPKFKKHDKAVEQAVSYGAAEGIKAEFVVYTNGTEWRVKRWVQGAWLDVTDIPDLRQPNALGSLDALLFSIDHVAPIIHKLDEQLSGKEARIFFEALQVFFHGSNLLTHTVDPDLKFGTDNLLRVISTGPDDGNYARGKLNGAGRLFDRYIEKSGIGHTAGEIGEERIGMFATFIATSLDPLREAGQSTGALNDELIRLIIALLHYLRSQSASTEIYPAVPATIHEPLRRFLTKALALNLNLALPDALESEITSDAKMMCGHAWDALVAEESRHQRDFVKGLGSDLFRKLKFWK